MNILFNELSILEQTKQALEKLGLTTTTDIQHLAIPEMIAGKDIIGQAQTGTGKTFAFAIPMIEKINVDERSVQGLIICPTRELTLQVYKEIVKLLQFNPRIRITSIYGGESYTKQFKALAEKPHIVVATPGRVIDHLQRRTVDFSKLSMLILDEADEMLKMGFQEDLETILKDTPRTRQTALFSATIPDFIKQVAKKYQHEPLMLKTETKTMTVEKINQYYYFIKKSDRDQLLIRVLDYYQPESVMIFANTKKDVDALSQFLQKNKYEADCLHGDLKQSQRDYVLNRFRQKRLTALIATDVAARGLDIPHVGMVINYELPFEDELYVHRIGRTGRAGNAGVSVSLVYPSMKNKLVSIERFTKGKMTELDIPTPQMIHEKRKIADYLAVKSLIQKHQVNHDLTIERLISEGFTENEIMAALIESYSAAPKMYEEINVPKQKIVRLETPRKGSRQKEGLYKWATINLGKKDGIRAVTLVDYFKKHADLYPKNIGDIVVSEKDTTFQIHPAAIKRLDSISNKLYGGKKIRYSILRQK
ncbi:MAG: DEAD/DEAH box helicase [Acholeplasmataceae bacterium]